MTLEHLMLERLKAKQREQFVMGHRLPEARPTLWAAFWGFVVFGVPVLVLGLLLDGLVQWVSGRCVGLWCYF
jgi:hypothetical protein